MPVKGCGTETSAPCSLMRRAVSTGSSPAGTSSCRKRPVISPAVDLTSAPTMTVKGAIFCVARPPSTELWSVTAMQLRPTRRHRFTSASGVVRQS